MKQDVELVVGHRYIIRTQASDQKFLREHCVMYLGLSTLSGKLSFSARPFAGTFEVSPNELKSFRRVDPERGAFMNHIIRVQL